MGRLKDRQTDQCRVESISRDGFCLLFLPSAGHWPWKQQTPEETPLGCEGCRPDSNGGKEEGGREGGRKESRVRGGKREEYVY